MAMTAERRGNSRAAHTRQSRRGYQHLVGWLPIDMLPAGKPRAPPDLLCGGGMRVGWPSRQERVEESGVVSMWCRILRPQS